MTATSSDCRALSARLRRAGDGGRSWAQQTLIEVPVVEGAPVETAPRVAAAGNVFRNYQPGQPMLLPPSLYESLPAERLDRFVAEMVEQHLGLGPFYAVHINVKGLPPYDPRMMLKVLLYGYLTGVRSSRKLKTAWKSPSRSGSWPGSRPRIIERTPSSVAGIWRPRVDQVLRAHLIITLFRT